MAALQDLIDQISDPILRSHIEQEVNKLSENKKFGLVFEEHIPEVTALYDIPIQPGCLAMLKNNKSDKTIYTVDRVDGDNAICINEDAMTDPVTIPLADLVCVAQFGQPIYPYLRKVNSICNAPDSDLWHTLIEADNYHALQLLTYLYEGKVDCIYIDPPYNKENAKDWKYNCNYVDSNDQYKHSKWLSMMEKRLKLAKKLLNPENSVLIVTIDETEYLHLGCLLEEIFAGANIQMISSIISPGGAARINNFARTNEFIYFVMLGTAGPSLISLSDDWRGNIKGGYRDTLRWRELQRTGSHNLRTDRPNLFYPIYLSTDGKNIVKIGDSLSMNEDKNKVPNIDGAVTIWPMRSNGEDGCWGVSQSKLVELIEKHYLKIGHYRGEKTSLKYLARGEQQKVENGDFPIIGYDENDGSIIVDESHYKAKFVPGSQWQITSHDATQYGTKLLSSIIEKRFTYPKSLYAVHDAIRFFVADNPNALIVDFFAGSGTTLHAVNLLNTVDNGHRRCVMVTNNEVSDAEAKNLTKQGYQPGDPEWEQYGIARYVTWPRTVCSIEGHDVNGEPLKGQYISDKDIDMSDGFRTNAVYFKLGFLDKDSVALGRQFRELLPVFWMKAGCIGPCPSIDSDKDLPQTLILPENGFAVLLDHRAYVDFVARVSSDDRIKTVYIVTDSESEYDSMIRELDNKDTYQIYRDYLDNFRINTEDRI